MTNSRTSVDYITDAEPPFYRRIPVKPAPIGAAVDLPDELRRRIVVDVVHDGNIVPGHLLRSDAVSRIEHDGSLWQSYVKERDWGAGEVASAVASALGLECYYLVTIARVVMDINRFPGVSPPHRGPMVRRAISDPMARVLTRDEARNVLNVYFDAISDALEHVIEGSLIRVAIHTYDAHNATHTKRPEMSIVTASDSYQKLSRLPHSLYDPLFPDILAECSTKHILRDRVAHTLQRAGINVTHNYPYAFPDGSLEVRAMPWLFFSELRRRFEIDFPDTRDNRAYGLVWRMLLNTNQRVAETEVLSSYLHRFSPAPEGKAEELAAAQVAYERIANYLGGRPELVEQYRRSPERTSSLGVEVRKDLLWRFDENGTPRSFDVETAALISRTLAEGISLYLRDDRVESP